MITRRYMLATLSLLAIPHFRKSLAENPQTSIPNVTDKPKTDARNPEMVSKDGNLSYLKNDSVDFKKLLPAPALIDSDETKMELEMLLHIQGARTAAEVAAAESMGKLTVDAFAGTFGEWFKAGELPQTVALIKKVEKDSKFYTGAAKDFYKRLRPAHDTRIKPSLAGDDEPSYPSGHATRGLLFALVLSELDPSKKDALLDRGRNIGWSRCVAGVHYPSDLIAGRVLAQAMFHSMSNHPKFVEAVAAAKAEITKARK